MYIRSQIEMTIADKIQNILQNEWTKLLHLCRCIYVDNGSQSRKTIVKTLNHLPLIDFLSEQRTEQYNSFRKTLFMKPL
jgi:hypothetical protein